MSQAHLDSPTSEAPIAQPAAHEAARARVVVAFGNDRFAMEGPEALVEAALERHLRQLAARKDLPAGMSGLLPPPPEPELPGLVRTAEVALPQPRGSASSSAGTDLPTWYRDRLIHPEERRGLVQDHVLVIVYWVTIVRGGHHCTTADIRHGFEALGLKVPNVPVMVYNLKSRGLLSAAEAYSAYTLTPAGRTRVEHRFSISA